MEGEFIGCERIVARLLEFSQIGIAEVLKVHIRSSARCAGGNYRIRLSLSLIQPFHREMEQVFHQFCVGCHVFFGFVFEAGDDVESLLKG